MTDQNAAHSRLRTESIAPAQDSSAGISASGGIGGVVPVRPKVAPEYDSFDQDRTNNFIDSLSVFSCEEVRCINNLVAASRDKVFRLESKTYKFSLDWRTRSDACSVELAGQVGEIPFTVGMDWWVFDHIVTLERFEDLPEDVRPLYLEVILEEICNVLEEYTSVPVKIKGIRKNPNEGSDLLQRLRFHIIRHEDGLKSHGFVNTNMDGLRLLSECAMQLAPVVHSGWDQISLRPTLEIGRIRMAMKIFKDVAQQDIIVIHHQPDVATDHIFCRLGFAPGYYLDCIWNGHNRITIGNIEEASMAESEMGPGLLQQNDDEYEEGPMHPEIFSEAEVDFSDAHTDHSEGPVENIDQLPVELVFEMGACTVSLKEMKSVNTGTILKTNTSDSAPVTIKANGRRVGSGEIVRLQGQLGVRVLELFQDV